MGFEYGHNVDDGGFAVILDGADDGFGVATLAVEAGTVGVFDACFEWFPLFPFVELGFVKHHHWF